MRAPRPLTSTPLSRSESPSDIDAALRLVDRGLELARDDAERHALTCFKGELLRDLGDIASSIATYRDAMAASPDEQALCRAQIGLADGLRVSEGLAEALALLDAAQEPWPTATR